MPSSSEPPVHPSRAPDLLPGPGLAAYAALALIRAYKLVVSPWFTGACRFMPTCADFTAEAIVRHGLVRGSWLGARRLGRCHPFGRHGHDPVPTSLAQRYASFGPATDARSFPSGDDDTGTNRLSSPGQL
jgi:putative membrane protein insertion efficiency factor